MFIVMSKYAEAINLKDEPDYPVWDRHVYKNGRLYSVEDISKCLYKTKRDAERAIRYEEKHSVIRKRYNEIVYLMIVEIKEV